MNAVAHRDYSVYGSKIRLFPYADRLEVYSPGGPPKGITIDAMPYRTFTRNQLLVSFLSRMRSAAPASTTLSHVARACGRFSRTARRIREGDPSTSCSGTSCG